MSTFVLVVLIGLVSLSQMSLSVPIKTFQQADVWNYDVIQLIQVRDTLNIIIGADNMLIRLDANLNLIESTSTGPACQPNHLNHCPENVAKNLLNGASVLVAEVEKQVLMFCGTAYYGRCSIYRWEKFGEPTLLDTKSKTSFIGSNISSIVTYQLITKDNRPYHGITVGMTYDGRPSQYFPLAVSTLTLRASGDIYSLEYVRQIRDYRIFSGVSVAERYQSTFLVEYVHAFVHDSFQYYLVVQRKSTVSTLYHTVLQRIRLDDFSYFSYVEIPLQCGAKSRYNIATAGYYGVIGPDLASSLKSGVRAGDAALYVTFSTGARYRVGDQRGSLESDSAVCVFTLSDIIEEFMQAQINCYNDMNSLATRVPWMINDNAESDCAPNSRIATLIPQTVRFAGNRLNPHIRSLQAVESREPLALYTDGVFSSLAITVRKMSEKNLTIGIAGTYDGKLVKFHLNGKTRVAFAVHQVSGSPATHVRRQMPFDAIEEHVYVLTHDKVHKFPVYSCRVYDDCAACVTSRDKTVECGWCHFAGQPGYCSERDECKTASWSENSCQPVVSRFTPDSGPLDGGTSITIYGSGFGNPDKPDDINLSVTVGLNQCLVQNHTFETIQCVTSNNPVTGSLSVAVHAVDKTTTLVPYIVDGDATAPTLFKYMSAVVETISPSYGPRSGGTNLTMIGTHLDIGGVQTVLVGKTNCTLLEKSSKSIVCQTQSVIGKKQEPGPSFVTLVIDRSSIASPVNFTYMPDPVITDITPLTSFISGGLNITILGHRMDVIQNPSMVIEFNNKEYVTSCHVEKNGLIMLCPAPGIDADPAHGNLTARISFLMDDVTDLRDFAKSHPYLSTMYYVQNPNYFKFETEVFSYVVDSHELYLKGIDLDLACTMEDVTVRIGINGVCNVTSLSSTELVCEPLGKPVELSDEEPSRAVWVYVGNLQYHIGDLRYVRPSTNLAAGIVIGFFVIVLALIILLLALYYCYRRRLGPFDRRHQNGASQLTSVVLFTNGRIPERRDYTAAPAPHERRGSNDYDLLLPPEYSAILPLLDGSGLRVHRNQITLLEKIGEGHFGCVWRGMLEREPEKGEGGYEVAVKTSRSTMASADVAAFLDEAMIMRDFHHEHVLSLIGICLDRDKGPMVILPFMHHGDLHTYICNPHNSPSVRDLIDFCLQIARGMEYLSEKKFVHRDLAARNCMLDETLLVKVADFGLARDVYEKDYYRPTPEHGVPLPVRWMAVECFEQNVFSTKTDVWAFGVVIWELMTRGIKPYPDVMENWDILSYLKKGRRLNKPQYCPPELYQTMLRCWELEPADRPSVTELVKEIDSLLVSLERRSASTVNSLYENVPTRGSY